MATTSSSTGTSAGSTAANGEYEVVGAPTSRLRVRIEHERTEAPLDDLANEGWELTRRWSPGGVSQD